MDVLAKDSAGGMEVTITHNLRDRTEVRELWNRRLIALDWGQKGPDPGNYTGAARANVELFHEMARRGAAVVGAYKGAAPRRSDRLIGSVEPGSKFADLNGLLCLPLVGARIVDASASFLGNLVPRQCTVQQCHARSRGRLAALVSGKPLPRGVWALHHLDAEWLVTNYLTTAGLCACVWSGGRSYENIDHAGVSSGDDELLAQTTVSVSLVAKKASRLLELALPGRSLYLFAPAEGAAACPPGIKFVSLESIFDYLNSLRAGKWLIDRMFSAAHSSVSCATDVGAHHVSRNPSRPVP